MDLSRTIQFDEVADLYDAYVNVDLDIRFFIQEARRVGGKTLELMCGTGRVSIPLLQAGVDLTCVDCSKHMLARLHETADASNRRATRRRAAGAARLSWEIPAPAAGTIDSRAPARGGP